MRLFSHFRSMRGLALVGFLFSFVAAARADVEEFYQFFSTPYKTGAISTNWDYGQLGANATSGPWTWSTTGNAGDLRIAADGALYLQSRSNGGLQTNALDFTTVVLSGAEAFSFNFSSSGFGIGSIEWTRNGTSFRVLENSGSFNETFTVGDIVGFRVTSSHTSENGNAFAQAVISGIEMTEAAAVPEPATYAAWMAGAAGLVALRLRRRKASRLALGIAG